LPNIAKGTIFRIGQTAHDPERGPMFMGWEIGYTTEQKMEAERQGQEIYGTYYNVETGEEFYCGFTPAELVAHAEANDAIQK
jgi:hypothetical protein